MTLPFTLRQLEYFDAIASEGSISSASERCHVSSTALSLALDELERNLDLQLAVRRKGKGITLTTAGAALLRHAQQLLSGAEALAAEASQSATGLKGRLVIGCFPTLTPFVLPAAMEKFARQHAGLNLEFEEGTTAQLLESLLGGRIDVAVLYGVDVSKQVEFEPISQHRPYVIVGENHRLASRQTISLAELVGEPQIQIDMRPSRQNTENIFTSFGLRPLIQHTTTNYEFARCLVGRGLGYSIVIQRPRSMLTYDGHGLVMLEISDKIPATVVGLARPRGAPRAAKYEALKAFMTAHAQLSTQG